CGRPRPPPPTLFPYTTLFRSEVPRGPVLLPPVPPGPVRALRPSATAQGGPPRPARGGSHGPADRWWLAHPGHPVRGPGPQGGPRSEEHTSELQSRENLVCRLL